MRIRAGVGVMVLAGALAISASQAAAQQVGDAIEGRRLATAWCASCHVVGRGGPGSGDAAPPFPAIAAMPSTTALSLRAFLQQPHDRMPDWNLTRNELDDLIAYILSLRGN